MKNLIKKFLNLPAVRRYIEETKSDFRKARAGMDEPYVYSVPGFVYYEHDRQGKRIRPIAQVQADGSIRSLV